MPPPFATIVAAILLGLAAPDPATAKPPVPIQGSMVANVTQQYLIGPEAVTAAEGSGNVSHLGKTSTELAFAIDLSTPDLEFEGTMTMTAANGDELFATFGGYYIEPDAVRRDDHFRWRHRPVRRSLGSADLTGYDIDGNPNNFSVTFGGSISY